MLLFKLTPVITGIPNPFLKAELQFHVALEDENSAHGNKGL